MVKRKTTRKTARRAASPAKRIYRRRRKSGISEIPAAAATVGLLAANADYLKYTATVLSNGSKFGDKVTWMKNNYPNLLKADRLKKDAIYAAAGYVGGYLAKKYAPSVIKTPMGKIAKKIPKMKGL